MSLKFNDLLDAFEFVGALGFDEQQAVLCRQSGKIYLHSDSSDFDELNEEMPEDVDDDEKYLEIPDKRELDLGKPLALDFARQVFPDDFEEVYRLFRSKGAYTRFKNLLARRRVLDRWYDFERKATERALREWCALNSVVLDD